MYQTSLLNHDPDQPTWNNIHCVAFVNAFLQTIIEDGTWARLWQISLGDRTGIDIAPEAPAIGE